jgi:hypothetical protein
MGLVVGYLAPGFFPITTFEVRVVFPTFNLDHSTPPSDSLFNLYADRIAANKAVVGCHLNCSKALVLSRSS